MQLLKSAAFRFLLLSSSAVCTLFLISCTPAEEQGVINALSDLQKNRDISEQFVKDTKNNFEPGDEQYGLVLSKYDKARDAYNEYIAGLEANANDGRGLASTTEALTNLKAVCTDFISAAARALDPETGNRALQIDKAIVIPPNLSRSIKRLPRALRDLIAKTVGPEMRLRPWSQIS